MASRGSFAISIAVDGNSVLTIRDTAVFTGIMEKFPVLPSQEVVMTLTEVLTLL